MTVGDRTVDNRQTTETHCHCGAKFEGSDHCPECFCEKYERYCNHVAKRPYDARAAAEWRDDCETYRGSEYE